MTLFKDSSVQVPVSEENILRFIDEYSPEVVQGYKMALKDIFGQIEEVTFEQTPVSLNKPKIARQLMLRLYHAKSDLLHKFDDLGISDATPVITPA